MEKKFLPHLLSAALLAGHAGLAIAQSNAGERKVRIEVTRNENGSQSRVTREFDLNDQQQLQDALRELGVLDEMNMIGDGENLVIDLRRTRDGGMLDDMSMALSIPDMEETPSAPRPYLGVYYGDWSPSCDKDARKSEPPVKEGASITHVEDDSPAAKAGLREDDIVVELGGKAVKNGEDLVDAIAANEPGDKVKVVYYRGKAKNTTTVTLGQREDDNVAAPAWNWNWGANGQDFGDAMKRFSQAFSGEGQGAFLGVDGDDDDGGVRITNVVDSSAAERMGLKEGDIIRSINGTHIGSFDDLAELMGNTEPQTHADVVIERNGKEMKLSGALGKRKPTTWSWNNGFPFVDDMAPVPPAPPAEDTDELNEDLDRMQEDQERAGEEQRAAAEEQRAAREAQRAMREEQRAASDEMRQQMDELRREMDRLRRDLRGEVTREMRVTVDAVKLSPADTDVLKKNGVSIDNALELPGLRLAPNPSAGMFDLAFQVPERGDLTVDVHDAKGERIYHESISGFKGSYQRTLDMTDRPNGTYFIVIAQNGKTEARKIVKQ